MLGCESKQRSKGKCALGRMKHSLASTDVKSSVGSKGFNIGNRCSAEEEDWTELFMRRKSDRKLCVTDASALSLLDDHNAQSATFCENDFIRFFSIAEHVLSICRNIQAIFSNCLDMDISLLLSLLWLVFLLNTLENVNDLAGILSGDVFVGMD